MPTGDLEKFQTKLDEFKYWLMGIVITMLIAALSFMYSAGQISTQVSNLVKVTDAHSSMFDRVDETVKKAIERHDNDFKELSRKQDALSRWIAAVQSERVQL